MPPFRRPVISSRGVLMRYGIPHSFAVSPCLPAAALLALLLVTAGPISSTALAGPNAGGALLVHALEGITYTTEHVYGYCHPRPDDPTAPRNEGAATITGRWVEDCSDVDSSFSDAATPQVWVVYASFTDDNYPSLAGVEFGIEYSPGLRLLEWGSCADFEASTANWPASGSGTIVVWVGEHEERLVPAYWFAGYAPSSPFEEQEGLHFSVTPHPINGGHFADRSPAPVLDDIALYGTLGFGQPGTAPCPSVETYVIRADGSGDFPTIQDALSIAAPTSVIELEDGVFSGEGNRDLKFNFTSFTLKSISGDPERCVIDCGGSQTEQHRGIRFDPGTRASRVEGIGFRNRYSGSQLGIATQATGGAILANGGHLTLSNCVFEDCATDREGGAIAGSGFPLVIEDCAFRRCVAKGGAAGALEIGGNAKLVLRRTEFTDNRVEHPLNGHDDGGAIRVVTGNLVVEDCVFQGNRANRGGAAYLLSVDAQVSGTTWSDNHALAGGSVYMAQNQVRFDHCTFVENGAIRGGSIFVDVYPSELSVDSSILAFGPEGDAIWCGGANVSVRRSDIYGNAGGDWVGCIEPLLGTGENIQRDPLFCDLEGGVFTLDSRSPCALNATSERPAPMGSQPVGCGPSVRGVVPEALAWDLARAVTESSPESRFGFVRITPNPASRDMSVHFSAPSLHGAELIVLDSTGRRVQRLVATRDATPGEFVATWDGRDAKGRDVPSGAYFIRLSAGEKNVTQRVSILR